MGAFLAKGRQGGEQSLTHDKKIQVREKKDVRRMPKGAW